jgi:putative ABC transport system substrate-binding protein
MRRREFITLLGTAAAAWPLAAGAQQVGKVFRVGFLSSYSVESGKALLACLDDGLRQLGWVEGRNIHFDYRWSGGGATPLPALAAELVRLNPDLIIVSSTPGAQAVQQATPEIPAVFIAVSDPVASGIVASLARPGGNLTGVSNFLPATTGKLLELLRAAAPSAVRFAVFRDPNNAGKQLELGELKALGRDLGVTIEAVDVRTSDDIEHAFSTRNRMGADALITLVDGVTMTNRYRIAELAAKHRLPTIFQVRDFVDAGGLMSYGLNYCQHWRSAAAYVDRILKGNKPADLPVQQPTKFELIINLETAKAIGLTVPPTLLGLADELIE